MSEKFGFLLWILRNETDGRYLIFCNTKAATERLDHLLNANGYKSAGITGDLPQKKRMKVLSSFKDGKLPILVATDVASRGIHIEGVTHVINYDLPQDSEDYVHRIGRTARAGAEGRAISLACEEYVHSLSDVEDFIKQKIPVTPLTEEMIVTEYRKAPRRIAKKSTGPQRKRAEEQKHSRPKAWKTASAKTRKHEKPQARRQEKSKSISEGRDKT